MSTQNINQNPLSKPFLKDQPPVFVGRFNTISKSEKKPKIHFGVLTAIALAVFLLPNIKEAYAQDASVKKTVQTMPILEAPSAPASEISTGPKAKVKDVAVLVDGNSLAARPMSQDGGEEIILSSTDLIATYEVKDGDTISEIADQFGISVNTVVWANDLDPKKPLKKGQSLVILPVSGVKYTIKKGDTLKKIATTFKGDVDEIISYNNLANETDIHAGEEIIIPKGEITKLVTVKPIKNIKNVGNNTNKDSSPLLTGSAIKDNISGYFIRPTKGVKTQGLHGHNGVDFASSLNSPIYAAASGKVIIVKVGGWGGGYGTYIVISHNNGTQTLYAHLNDVNVSQGDTVNQGDVIGYMGKTGDSTGVHVHFEVRGGVNPF